MNAEQLEDLARAMAKDKVFDYSMEDHRYTEGVQDGFRKALELVAKSGFVYGDLLLTAEQILARVSG